MLDGPLHTILIGWIFPRLTKALPSESEPLGLRVAE
jgi:hypothetical protein